MRMWFLGLTALAGCAHTHPDVLRIDAADYDRAFDAAIEAGRRHGMPPSMRDRRRGIIETEPRTAGSLLEPWRTDNASLGQVTENTIAYSQRVARFEFEVPDLDEPVPPADGVDLLATGEPEVDLTTYTGPLELRVWVFVEREYRPGGRRNTWSRLMFSEAGIRSAAAGAATGKFWAPVSRDFDYERRLLGTVAGELEKAP